MVRGISVRSPNAVFSVMSPEKSMVFEVGTASGWIRVNPLSASEMLPRIFGWKSMVELEKHIPY